jgi:O-antigen/teichoic acid export membrane protein
MKTLIKFYAFWYGCLGSLFVFVWYIAAIRGHATMPDSVWIVEAVFVLHAAAALATFQRTSTRPAWQPVLDVTPARIRLARTLFALSIVNFLVCLGVFLYAEYRGNEALGNAGVALILTSFLLLNTVYIAIHWAFRPENLFSSSFLRVIANPLGELFSNNKKP